MADKNLTVLKPRPETDVVECCPGIDFVILRNGEVQCADCGKAYGSAALKPKPEDGRDSVPKAKMVRFLEGGLTGKTVPIPRNWDYFTRRRSGKTEDYVITVEGGESVGRLLKSSKALKEPN